MSVQGQWIVTLVDAVDDATEVSVHLVSVLVAILHEVLFYDFHVHIFEMMQYVTAMMNEATYMTSWS